MIFVLKDQAVVTSNHCIFIREVYGSNLGRTPGVFGFPQRCVVLNIAAAVWVEFRGIHN
jgi:hypothetical protein